MAEEQPRVPGRVLVLDRRGVGQPQRRVFRDHDAGDPVDPEAADHQRGEELRAVEGEVCGRGTARLLGAALVQADQQRGSRRDHQPADVRPVPEQLSVAQRPHRRRFLLRTISKRSHTHTLFTRSHRITRAASKQPAISPPQLTRLTRRPNLNYARSTFSQQQFNHCFSFFLFFPLFYFTFFFTSRQCPSPL